MALENKPLVENQSGAIAALLQNTGGLLVKQTPRGWLQECFGCEAKSEFKISEMDWSYIQPDVRYRITEEGMQQPDILYALEESSCFVRCCWRDGRPFTMSVSEGGEAGGRELAKFTKPCTFPLRFVVPLGDNGDAVIPCCCFLPNLATRLPNQDGYFSEADGAPEIGTSTYKCTPCPAVPVLEYAEFGEPVYVLKPETCCGGCCLACNPFTGKGVGFVPFYFHDPNTMEVIGGSYDSENTPQIRKMWSGLKKECCTTADTFAVMFPPNIEPARKAGILGLTFLLDFTVFERQVQK